jgi:cyclic pyranopterin phosphate synthase
VPEPQLIDQYNRRLNYLRLSITDRCNLQCAYCVPRDLLPKLAHDEILTYEEVLRIVRLVVGLGVTKIRVTGGEPLVRKGVYAFLARLTKIAGLEDVSLTTNGVLLKENLHRLKTAGIRRINISLDTLNPVRYAQITGHDRLAQVWAAILEALAMGFHPIKLNVVALREINDDELIDLARLSVTHPLHVRFIEQMPLGDARLRTQSPLLTPEIRKRIEALGKLHPVRKEFLDGPAQRFALKGARGEIGFISAISHHFCEQCNRLRLTASGQLRPCLLADHQVDLKTPLRQGATDAELALLIRQAAAFKPPTHAIGDCRANGKIAGQMSAIGG